VLGNTTEYRSGRARYPCGQPYPPESSIPCGLTFPPSIHVHCPEQKFYFNDAGYLVRNDYAPEVTHRIAAHYTFDHKNFDGFIFPSHRRVVLRDANGHTLLTAPSIFRLDIESVVLSRA